MRGNVLDMCGQGSLMPLSKERQAQYMRDYRKRIRYNVIPNYTTNPVPDAGPYDGNDGGDLVIPKPPLYQQGKKYPPGTEVRDLKGRVFVAPELDGNNQVVYEEW